MSTSWSESKFINIQDDQSTNWLEYKLISMQVDKYNLISTSL